METEINSVCLQEMIIRLMDLVGMIEMELDQNFAAT